MSRDPRTEGEANAALQSRYDWSARGGRVPTPGEDMLGETVAHAPLIGADEVIEELGEWRPQLDALLAEAERTPAGRAREDVARRLGEFLLIVAARLDEDAPREECDACAGRGVRYSGGPECHECSGEGAL